MATPREKLAASLEVLQQLQKDGRRVFRSSEFSRTHRERLVSNGYLTEVIKAWLVSSSPSVQDGDTTPFFATFWEFCAAYCEHRFGESWHLSAEVSLLVHAESMTVQRQTVINAEGGSNNTLELPFGTSLYDLRQEMPPPDDLEVHQGLRVFRAEAALIRVSPQFFSRNPISVQAVIGSLRDVGPLLSRLLDGGHSSIAGRLVGAFRRIGRDREADRIKSTMTAAGYDVREVDPFDEELHVAALKRSVSPIAARMRAMWERHRSVVIGIMPPAPGLPEDPVPYLTAVQESYTRDAYHSLSIEGYSVTTALIERVRQGDWQPDGADRDNRDALAAKGYDQAFGIVRGNIEEIIRGADAAEVWDRNFMDWYVAMFTPSVSAGILKASELAGFRSHPVYIQNSFHAPPRVEAVADGMETLADLMKEEPDPAVKAVLGHWLFGYVHPFPDGNGRIARFTMNLLLSAGGYPWTIIRVDDRDQYMSALEAASVGENLEPFATFIASCLRKTV